MTVAAETHDNGPAHLSTTRSVKTSLTRTDWAIAFGLCIATLATLLATSNMGTTRDESFYFRYAAVYQEWFERVAGDSDATGPSEQPLGRKDVIATWSQNL